MRQFYALSLIILSLIILTHCTHQKKTNSAISTIQNHILSTNALLEKQIDTLIDDISHHQEKNNYQVRFDGIRATFKKMEWAIAFYMPETNRFMNGPNLDEIEFEENTILEAEGLQTLEEFFYPTYEQNNETETIRHLRKLKNKTQTIDTYFSVNTIDLSQILEALRTEVFRVTTLGITGFDTPISGKGLQEAKYTLDGIDTIFQLLKTDYPNNHQIKEINEHIHTIKLTLKKNENKDDFNYLSFIDKDLNHLSKLIFQFTKSEKIPQQQIKTALKKESPHLFTKDAWDANFYTPNEKHNISSEKIALGKILFNEKKLSGDGKRSCQSCHNPELAFTDGLKTPLNTKGKPLLRNSPSLTYANFQHGQFWDMRREDLESQSSDVITNEDEMHGSFEKIIEILDQNTYYKKEFNAIYKSKKIEVWQIQNSIASYIRSLSTFNSDFDHYMQGDKKAINQQQIDGFNLFVGKAKCATCHFLPLFNGTVPPEYSKTESEVLGTSTDGSNKTMSPDIGRGAYSSTLAHTQHAFKTPSLRNIAITAPYMHNGGYKNLEDVIEFYNQGGGQAFGFDVKNQTLPADKLNLNTQEVKKIIAFLHALTDQQYKKSN